MKLLVIINGLGTGGAEKLLVETLPEYSKRGLKVELALLNAKDFPFLKKIEESTDIPVHKLSNSSVYNPMLVFKIIPLIKKYDLVHVHLFPAIYWVGFASFLSRNKTPLIFTEHSTHNRRRFILFRWLDRIIYNRYKLIIAISEGVKIALQKHLGYAASKLKLIENGINLNKIKHAEPLENKFFPEDPNIKIIVHIARFYAPKDQATVIRAMKLLPDNVKLLFIGDGERIEICKQLVGKLDLGERIKFLGVRSDVPQLLKLADIVVLSSEYEGQSLAAIEGMASGRPFVATDVPGLREIVADNGILFPFGDEARLAEIISELNQNIVYREEVIKACLERSSQFDIQQLIDEHMNVYKTFAGD